ncbi:MAG TPA: hypothetical protein VHS99_03415 [Chloroflexota bacterium]|nr:hypothetical protein [Chloroflexota bacterium]
MWARNAELLLACWLAASPFIFRHGPDEPLRWANDLACAVVVGAVALLSHRRRQTPIHLLNAAAGLWLVATSLLGAGAALPAPAAHQNWIVVGLLLLMLGILPSEAARPPRAWREFPRL